MTLQVVPLDARHQVFGESFVIFRFGPDDDAMLRDVVCTEHLRNDFSVEGERQADQPLNLPPSPSIGPASPFMVIPGGMRGAMIDFQPLETCK